MNLKFWKKSDENKDIWQPEPLEKYWAEGSNWRKQNVDYRYDVMVQKNAISIAFKLNFVLGFLCVVLALLVVIAAAFKLSQPLERVYFQDGTMILCELNEDGSITHISDGLTPPIFEKFDKKGTK